MRILLAALTALLALMMPGTVQAQQYKDTLGTLVLGGQIVDGTASSLNIPAATTVLVKPSAGRLVRISVTTAGSTAGSAFDAATTGAAGAATLVASIPAAAGVIYLDWPCLAGIVITTGTGQVVSVSYN